MEKILKVKGMHCKSCEILLSDVLSEISGISKISIDHKSGMLRFTYTNESLLTEVKKVIEEQGYTVA